VVAAGRQRDAQPEQVKWERSYAAHSSSMIFSAASIHREVNRPARE